MDIQAITATLPHRYPFLLVDRVLEMSADKIVAVKNVSVNEAHFQGHFPQKPVMPGVLIIEALAQAAGVLLLSKPEYKGKLAYLAGVDEARFRRMVVPGDQLRLEAEIIKLKARVGMCKTLASVDGQEACSAQIMFGLGD
ncbi:MAG: 3-hydroxyacyl-[acyl-carrier-protein] dehydratase FabZ [Candidatus Omnitrophica bacterium]|nr:3-hydroxyacyl-[acyl-carrier-protein] dehydratase FabZ [Candidatus Omnitrophota bacterium]